MPTVLIPTSGTGSRLGARTKHTNKSLVKVGDMYAICHILDLYQDSTEFVITLGHYGSHVKQFLQLAYPSHNFTFVEVNRFEGPGSSLGYSMLQAKEHLQKPFVFHCCDALLKEALVLSDQNCLYGVKGTDTSQYSSFLTDGSSVQTVQKKGADQSDYLYIGVACIQDYQAFWTSLQALYDANSEDTSLSDVYAIQSMIREKIPFTYQEVSKWYDTGNEVSFQALQAEFPMNYNVLEKYDESLCFFKDRVIKFFADAATCQKRVERGNLLFPLSPRILGSSPNFFCMEKIEGTPLGDSFAYGDISRLLSWANANLWNRTETRPEYKDSCLRFYKQKTYQRIKAIPFLAEEKTIINGVRVGSWITLLDRVNFDALTTDTFSHYHGDFILDNIIKKQDNSFTLLDWRQDFDGHLEYGDMYYDLAKLRHNIYFNHTNILRDLYTVEYKDEEVLVNLQCNYAHICQEKAIQEFAQQNGLDYSKVKILTAVVWLNMSSLYEGKLREFLYYFGKLNLALALDSSIAVL